MTISDATPHNTTQGGPCEEMVTGALSAVNSVHFTLGPHVTAVEAMQQATATAASVLPSLLAGLPDAARVGAEVQAVLTELVDVTARYRAGLDLVVSIECDGQHVTVSAGEMSRPLPPPEEEPGLYLVHRMAVEVGQHEGDLGGRVTWAALRAA